MPNLPKQPRPTDKHAIRQAWAHEQGAAHRARSAGDAAGEWSHLERAHIISQPLAVAHVRTHLAMLRYGLRHRDVREIAGQVLRLAVAAPGTWSGRYPAGNTGGSNLRALQPLAVPPDLRPLLSRAAATATGTGQA